MHSTTLHVARSVLGLDPDAITHVSQWIINNPVGWLISADRDKFWVAPRGAGAELKIPLPRSFVPTHGTYMLSFIDVDEADSEFYGFENVDTAWTDGRTDGHSTGFISHPGRDN